MHAGTHGLVHVDTRARARVRAHGHRTRSPGEALRHRSTAQRQQPGPAPPAAGTRPASHRRFAKAPPASPCKSRLAFKPLPTCPAPTIIFFTPIGNAGNPWCASHPAFPLQHPTSIPPASRAPSPPGTRATCLAHAKSSPALLHADSPTAVPRSRASPSRHLPTAGSGSRGRGGLFLSDGAVKGIASWEPRKRRATGKR